MSNPKVLILATDGLTTNLLVETLMRLNVEPLVIIEEKESKKTVIKRRLKKLGVLKTVGQLLFLVLVLPFISKKNERIQKILKQYNLKGGDLSGSNVTNIDTIHNPILIRQINSFNPDLVVINGTRILKKQLLNSIHCPIVNIHVGITPKYRGVHGGYWAIRNKDFDLFGVTFHFVDAGIDTGGIIEQSVIQPDTTDNFKTYPILQYCEGLKLLTINFNAIISGNKNTVKGLTTASKLNYHPTITDYLFGKKRIS